MTPSLMIDNLTHRLACYAEPLRYIFKHQSLCSQCNNFMYIFFREFSVAVTASLITRSVYISVKLILACRYITKILQVVITFVTIQVGNLKSLWTFANESSHHKLVNLFVVTRPIFRQLYNCVVIGTFDLKFSDNGDRPSVFSVRPYNPRPHTTAIRYFIQSFVADNRQPSFFLWHKVMYAGTI